MGPQLDIRSPGSFADTINADPEAWAIRIAARWRMGVESIIATGRLINEAKKALPHGAFGKMIREQLPFGERQAQMLMVIGSHPRLSNPQHIALLPPTLGTIYDAVRLSDDEWDMGVQRGIIRPDMERADIEQIRPRALREPTSSDGGGEATSGTPERPAGTGDRLAEPLAAVTPAADQPSQQPRPEDDERERKDAGVATGPSEATPMPGGGLAIAHSRVEPSDSLDFFPTPPWATRALIEHVFDNLGRRGHCGWQVCWEPACGEGHMSETLAEYFREVVASDIKDYGYNPDQYVVDFLTCEQLNRRYDADWIITNPPFNDSTEFVLNALRLAGTGVAMFVRLSWLESVGRYEKIFRDSPPTKLAIFTERVPLHKGRWEENGATMTAYVWLVWIKGAEPQAPFWIPPGCREALTKPDDAARFGIKDINEAPAAEAAE